MLNVKRVSLEDADILIRGAWAKAQEIGVAMCIAVTDEAGYLIAFKRMDGRKPRAVDFRRSAAACRW